MKECSVCKQELPVENFYRDRARKDGLLIRCKDCERKLRRKTRVNNNGIYIKKDRKYYQAHKEEIKEKRRKYHELNREKIKARGLVRTALKNGSLIRPKTCEKCDAEDPHAHHEDYDRPLEVVWLCRICHMRLHQGK